MNSWIEPMNQHSKRTHFIFDKVVVFWWIIDVKCLIFEGILNCQEREGQLKVASCQYIYHWWNSQKIHQKPSFIKILQSAILSPVTTNQSALMENRHLNRWNENQMLIKLWQRTKKAVAISIILTKWIRKM